MDMNKSPGTLREAISQSGLTAQQIIAKVGCTRESLTNWRKGKTPNDYYIGQLSKVLGVNLWPIYANEAAPDETSISSNAINLQTVSTPKAQHIDDAMQRFISQQTASLWDNFHFTQEQGSINTLQLAVSSHIQMLQSLLVFSLPQSEQQWVMGTLCEATILTARIARDQMDYALAIAHHKSALQMAQQCQSSDHIIAATMRLAETLWEFGLAYDALAYCDAGIAQTRRANPRIRGELLGLAAMIYGAIGDFQQSQKHINEAALLAVGAAKMPTTGGINFSETSAANYQANEALRHGDLRLALSSIERARQLIKIEFPGGHNIRWEAHLWINQARIHSEAREIEAACEDLRQAARLAQSITSRIALKKVQDTARELISHQKQSIPALQTLHKELIQIATVRTLP